MAVISGMHFWENEEICVKQKTHEQSTLLWCRLSMSLIIAKNASVIPDAQRYWRCTIMLILPQPKLPTTPSQELFNFNHSISIDKNCQ